MSSCPLSGDRVHCNRNFLGMLTDQERMAFLDAAASQRAIAPLPSLEFLLPPVGLPCTDGTHRHGASTEGMRMILKEAIEMALELTEHDVRLS